MFVRLNLRYIFSNSTQRTHHIFSTKAFIAFPNVYIICTVHGIEIRSILKLQLLLLNGVYWIRCHDHLLGGCIYSPEYIWFISLWCMFAYSVSTVIREYELSIKVWAIKFLWIEDTLYIQCSNVEKCGFFPGNLTVSTTCLFSWTYHYIPTFHKFITHFQFFPIVQAQFLFLASASFFFKFQLIMCHMKSLWINLQTSCIWNWGKFI